jgi:hypothetical protein
MARIHAQAANFSFNAVAIEDELNKIEMSIDVDTPEITAFADTGKAFVVGKYDAKYEVGGDRRGLQLRADLRPRWWSHSRGR